MTAAFPVTVRPLMVTQIYSMRETAILLPPQVCAMAKLVPGEMVEVHNLSTRRIFVARLQIGRPAMVEVHGYADPDLSRGDALLVVAGKKLRGRVPAPDESTVCLCERNSVIEIRDASSRIPVAHEPLIPVEMKPGAYDFMD